MDRKHEVTVSQKKKCVHGWKRRTGEQRPAGIADKAYLHNVGLAVRAKYGDSEETMSVIDRLHEEAKDRRGMMFERALLREFTDAGLLFHSSGQLDMHYKIDALVYGRNDRAHIKPIGVQVTLNRRQAEKIDAFISAPWPYLLGIPVDRLYLEVDEDESPRDVAAAIGAVIRRQDVFGGITTIAEFVLGEVQAVRPTVKRAADGVVRRQYGGL